MKNSVFIILILLFSLTIKSLGDENQLEIKEGNDDAKVQIFVFESLTCPHCASFNKNIYPDLKKDFIDKGLVQIHFKSFPLDLAGLNAAKITHCSNKDIRFNLDLVDACIKAEGGNIPIHKYCIGAILMNNNIHVEIVKKLRQLTEIMDGLKTKQLLNPIPNPRILDQYAMWIIWSRIGATNALFGVQDVTHSWIEPKHEE